MTKHTYSFKNFQEKKKKDLFIVFLAYGIITLANLSAFQGFLSNSQNEVHALSVFNSFAIFCNIMFIITILFAAAAKKKENGKKK